MNIKISSLTRLTWLLVAVFLVNILPANAEDSVHDRIQSVASLPDEQIDLAETLLLISKEWDPALDIDTYRARLNALVEKAGSQISGKTSPKDIVAALRQIIHQQEGYNYTDQVDENNIPTNPAEIFLHGLLDTKRGYCMNLSLLYLILGEKLRLPLHGVALPNHFFVRYESENSHINIETTQSGESLPDSYYLQRFDVSPSSGFFMKPLGKRQTLGAYFSNVGMTYYKQSIRTPLTASAKIDLAISYLSLATQINPASIEAHNNLGNIFSERKQHDAAIEQYLLALKYEPDSLSTLFNLGLAHADAGNREKAVETLLQVVQIEPRFIPGHRALAQLFLNSEKFFSALLHLKKIAALEPSGVQARLTIAQIYLQLNLFELSLESLKNAQTLFPEDSGVLSQLAETYYRMGNLDRAIAQYHQLIEYHPGNVEAYIQLGWTYYKKKQIPLAIAWTTRGLSQAESNPQIAILAYMNLGLFHLLDAKFSTAESWYRKALESENLNALESMLGDLDEASETFPQLAEIDYFTGWIFFEAREKENARKFLNKYLQRAENGELASKARDLLNQLQGKKSDLITMTIPTDTPPPMDSPDDMVFVPEGFFIMGSSEHGEDEKPEHKVFLSSYFIDKYEVTAKEYAEFLNETGNEKKYYQVNKYGTIDYDNGFKPVAGLEPYPVNNVSWFGAEAYCKWKNKRLPTEAEWEKAARGPNGQIYPWGDSRPIQGIARFGQSWTEETRHQVMAPVDAIPQGKSFYGAYNMAGNVKEWVDDWFDREYYSDIEHKINPLSPIGGEYKVLRGGSWRDLAGHIYSSFRNNGYPENRLDDYGFRCAKSVGEVF